MENYLLEQVLLAQTYSNWDNLSGRRIRMVYYTGVESGNPSGSTDNAKFIYYEKKVSGTTDWKSSLIKQLTYDANDNLLTSTALTN